MRQEPLFAPEPPAIDVPGFVLVRGFVDAREEAALVARIDAEAWDGAFERRRQIYGLQYGSTRGPYGAVEVQRPIPAWLAALGARLVENGHLDRAPENVVVNEYLPGQGIAHHKDYPAFGPRVAAVSLGAPYVLDLALPDEGLRRSIDLPPRSLFVLSGEARARWTHGIAARQRDTIDGAWRPRGRRISVTFRTKA